MTAKSQAEGCRVAAFAPRHYDEDMSFSDTIFLFFLALVLFGPKKLPEMARQAGRLLAELRRASNEFKSQIETEIAHLETEQKRTIPPSLPASPPPQGTLAQGTAASVSSTEATVDPIEHQPGPHEFDAAVSELPISEASVSVDSPATLAASVPSSSASSPSAAPDPALLSNSAVPGETAETAPASQESHV